MKALHCIFSLPPTTRLLGGHIICEISILVIFLLMPPYMSYCKAEEVKLLQKLLEHPPTYSFPNRYI